MSGRAQGNIQEREKDKKYLIRWWKTDPLTGLKRHAARIVNGDYPAAMIALAKELKDEPEPAPPKKITFDDYLAGPWAQYTADNWKNSTRITQGSLVKAHITPFFTGKLLADINPLEVVKFYALLEQKGLTVKTRHLIHSILSKMFSYACDELELIERSPVKKGLAPKEPEDAPQNEKSALTPEQMQELFRLTQPRYKAFFLVLGLCGVRTGEALGLKWSDIDLASRELHIRRAVYRGRECSPKTKHSYRTRPIVPQLYQALLNHKAMANYTAPSDYVFASSTGKPMNPDQCRENLQAILRKKMMIKLPARADGLHLLRHSSGSAVYMLTGGDLKQTQSWLGHSQARVTLDTYTHLPEGHEKKTAQLLEQGIFARPDAPGIVQ